MVSERGDQHEDGTCRGTALDRLHTPWRVHVRLPSYALSSAICKDPDPITLEVNEYNTSSLFTTNKAGVGGPQELDATILYTSANLATLAW